MDFKDDYIQKFEEILQSSTGVNSVFKMAMDNLKDEFKHLNISDEARAKLSAQLLAEVSIAFTTRAMEAALDVSKSALTLQKEIEALELKNQMLKDKLPLEKEHLQEQIRLTKAQTDKILAETQLAKEQHQAVKEQVIDNRIIKATAIAGEFMQNISAGQLSPTAEMYEFFFDLVREILKRDNVALKKISNYTIPKTPKS